ncbi:hypothetical protein IWW56_005707 [Coemansia sp. RSA 2131]|nr:hypothetical protein IWW56_005707 [Coemansia sp. RSA 2131]
MDKINIEMLKETCGEIVRNGDLDTLTDRMVRRSAEENMGLESKALDIAPYKQLVKDTVAEVLAALPKEQESGNSGAAESEEDESAGEGEDDGKDEESSDKGGSEEEENGKDGSDNEEDEFSDVMDKEPPKSSRPKKREFTSTSPQTTKRAKTTSGNETTITNLKSYITKCGLRKVWAKELKNMNGAQQIRHLKTILDGLGMTGRPTLEKCKKIKAKRDLQAELEEMHVDNIISKEPEAGVARSRRRGARVVAYNDDHVSDSEEEEEQEEAGGEAEEQSAESEQEEESDAYTEAESDSGSDGDTKMEADDSDDDAGSA